jgi:hypothetical protein
MFAWRDNYISYNGASGDPYWNNVSFLQNYEYPSVSAVDTSTNNFVPALAGTARPSSFSPFSAGNGGSYRLDGTTATQFMFPNSTDYNAGTNNFTIECWVYLPAALSATTELFNIGSTQASAGQATCRLALTTARACYFLCNNAAGTGWINTGTSSVAVAIGAWTHIAGVRNGSNFTLYINGVSRLTYTSAVSVGYLGDSCASRLGNTPSGTTFTGATNIFITNARFVNGTAVYTAGFTPSTSPLTAITNTKILVTCQNEGASLNSVFTDYSVNAATVTPSGTPTFSGLSPFTNSYPGSINLVRASTQYLTVATNAAFTYATGDFTIETWVKFTSVSITQYIIDQRNSGTATAIIPTIYVDSATNTVRYYVNGADVITGTTAVTTGTWYHVAISKSSGSTKLFINGTQEGSTYTDSNNYAASRVSIGSDGSNSGTSLLNGQITNVRLSKGFAYYTSNFTPSTTPLSSNATYTSLLLPANGFSDLSTNGQLVTTPSYPGTVTISTTPFMQTSVITKSNYKFGTQSSYYSLNGYQTIVDNTSLRLGTGDFTIEAWVYRLQSGVAHSIICKGATTTGWILQINSSNQLIWTSGTTVLKTSTTTISSGVWTYVTITRSGTTGYMFIDGTQEGSTYTDNTNYNQTTNMFIGCNRANTSGLYGYLDDVRITKDVARYTASFTAPTSQLPTS